jgi:hypothetical protein
MVNKPQSETLATFNRTKRSKTKVGYSLVEIFLTN